MTARLSIAAALTLSLLLPAAASAQGAKGGSAVPLQFRALGDDGSIVTDLKPSDLSLKVNGKPRTIQSLTVYQASADASSAPLPPPFVSNTSGQGGRVIHVLVDDDSIAPGRESQVRDAVRILSSELSPTERIGLMTPMGTVNIAPTSDFTKVKLAAAAITGRAPTTETDQDAQCRTTHVFKALASMISLTGETPTTIVIFSGGLSPPTTNTVDVGRFERTPVGGKVAPQSALTDVCPVRPEDLQNLGTLASTANVDVYLFHLADAMPTRSATQDAGFESLAGATGGQYIEMPSAPQTAASRLLRDTSAYYVATYSPEPGEHNGQPQRVDLKTTRDKVKLRAHLAVLVAKEAAAKAVAPKDMLRVAAEYRQLPLRSTSYASRMPAGSDMRVVALFEPLDGLENGAALAAASVGLFDAKGTLKAQWTAQKDDLAKHPARADLQVPPGTYRVRVAVVDSSGRAGTTDDEVRAEPVRADPLTMSALVIGTRPAGGGFSPRLEFRGESVAIGLLEIYNVPKTGTVTVNLDVVSTPEGQPLATAETTLGKGSADDARTAIGGFAIGDLPPGDYLMRAVVSLGGKPVGKVVKTLRKTR
jgi:hypothetical protein